MAAGTTYVELFSAQALESEVCVWGGGGGGEERDDKVTEQPEHLNMNLQL